MRPLSRFLFIACVIASAVVLLGAPEATAQVQHETSDITGQERVSSTGLRDADVQNYAGDDIAYKAEYVYQPETTEESWRLTFYGFTDQRTGMTQTDRALVWIDGQRRRISEVTARARRIDDGVLEIQTATMSASTFRRIATGETVQFTIGSAEFDLLYEDRADMRAVLEEANEIASPGTQRQRADNGN
ncbi:MAG: hypothetical protein ACQETP_02970 [Bacteroidota bacterium]